MKKTRKTPAAAAHPPEAPKPAFSAEEICCACGGALLMGRPATTARGVSTDTRSLRGKEVFFALEGPNFDGHDYIADALDGGAAIIVSHKEELCRRLGRRCCFVLVDDTLQALARLAARHRSSLAGRVIAITGSCGKSTVKEMTGAILRRAGRCTVAPSSFNNRIGVSLTLLDAMPDDDWVVLELGANHMGEIDELAALARPDAGCITCIGESHLEGFGDIRGVCEAKSEIIPYIAPGGLLVLNADDPMCSGLARRRPGGDVRTFGFSQHADMRAVEIKSGTKGELFSIGDTVMHMPLHGRHNILNAAAAFALAEWAGATAHHALGALASITLPALRCQLRKIGNVDYLLDCYNSNPTAMRAACETLLRTQTPGRKIMVCGDMLELGGKADALHRDTGRMMAQSGIDMLIAVGEQAKNIVEGWRAAAAEPNNAMALPNAEKAWMLIHRVTRSGDTVMIKGSRRLRLEEVADAIGEYVAGLKQEAA